MNAPTLFEKDLRDLVVQINPPKDYFKNGKQAANKIFECLKSKTDYVNRVFIAGSSGKRTAVFSSDFDCVIFVNSYEAPFDKILDDFETILILNLDIDIVWRTKHSISLKFQGYDVDLLPASNFIQLPEIPPNPRRASLQALGALKRIEMNPQNFYLFSTCLCETQLMFLKSQSGYIHELVRLCKFWNKSIHLQESIRGRSSIIELIAVYAGLKEEDKKTCPTLLGAFVKFLNYIQNFQTLRIEFDFNPLSGLELIDQLQHLNLNKPKHVKTIPYIIEPANPFNNMAHNLDQVQMTKFAMFAAETLQRLPLSTISMLKVPLDTVFEAQPKVLGLESVMERSLYRNAKFLVGCCSGGVYREPSMLIRNENRYKNWEMQKILIGMQDLFSVKVKALAASWSGETLKDDVQKRIQDKIRECVDEALLGSSGNWGSSKEKHEDYDVTFKIPTEISNVVVTITISIKS